MSKEIGIDGDVKNESKKEDIKKNKPGMVTGDFFISNSDEVRKRPYIDSGFKQHLRSKKILNERKPFEEWQSIFEKFLKLEV